MAKDGSEETKEEPTAMRIQMQHVRAVPGRLWAVVGLCALASLIHFAHNAETLAYYPNMPPWITREVVYGAWLGVASVGVLGVLAVSVGFRVAGLVLLGLFGALGIDGLAHYGRASFAEHTPAANLTIAFEAITGLVTMILCWREAVRTGLTRRPHPDA
jgi:hypothetical protein